MGFSLIKRRAGDQKLSPAMKMKEPTIEANMPMVRAVLIILLAFSPEWGRNLISPIPSPRWAKAATNPIAAIMAEAKPTSSGE